jgi:hypothetical protein
MAIKLSKSDLDRAAKEGIVSAEQAEKLWAALAARGDKPGLSGVNVLYFFGAMLVFAALTLYVTLAWQMLSGTDFILIALVLGAGFAFFGRNLWFKRRMRVSGGVLVTLAVSMTPLFVYGLEKTLGIWPQGDPGDYADYSVLVKGSWIFLEIGTVAVGLLALRFVHFPFITFPIAFSLWFLTMDLAALIPGLENDYTSKALVTSLFGLVLILVSYLVDRRTREDYAFWGYLFGLLAFWGGLLFNLYDSSVGMFCYGAISAILILLSVFLQRRVFIVFGALGVAHYLGYLTWNVFEYSILFSFAVVAVGLGLIAVGVIYQRRREVMHNFIMSRIPPALKRLMPSERVAPAEPTEEE